MAQQDDTKTTTNASNAPRSQDSSGTKSSTTQTSVDVQHLQGGGTSSSPKCSSKAKPNHDHDDHGNHHHKKSVFTKVKEKARKLKKSISGRKRREENGTQDPYITPPGSAGSLDDDKDQPEYFGSPLYEARDVPNTDTQSGKQPENATPSLDSDDTNADSKQTGLTVSTHEDTEIAKADASSTQDKGLSVKEYIMHTFEPGEDERALSQAITQTISPKCKRVKEAVNSLLGNEEASDLISKNTNVEHDVTPSSSLTDSNDKKLTSLANDPNLSNALEPSLSNASNISLCSTPTSASLQNPNSG
ncbi:hypothetical protein M8C21_026526 [Ambrosia artemisiifolia]|uniref:Uncharacterized protein n=1 Tax=Ambrosia artemisiifolia TaxID=4212 RepID=A0AAD5GNK3_AMBAR|nr:hypothetical protein M8C21_026526 [Ambrosia artemisiifolia]